MEVFDLTPQGTLGGFVVRHRSEKRLVVEERVDDEPCYVQDSGSDCSMPSRPCSTTTRPWNGSSGQRSDGSCDSAAKNSCEGGSAVRTRGSIHDRAAAGHRHFPEMVPMRPAVPT